MDIVTYSDARNNLKSVLDKVVTDRVPTVIFRQRGGSVVLIPKDDYDALVETRYLMSNPVNAKRLLDSIARMDAGDGIEIDPKTMRPR